MSKVTKIKLITDFGELNYRDPMDLNIQLNRIVDDFQNIDNRFSDFSYDFSLPITKDNSLIFGFSGAEGVKKIFVKNKNIACRVYCDDDLLLDGLINLESVTKDSYNCKLYSKFKELIDLLNEPLDDGEDRTLKSLNIPLLHDWHYETSIVEHINANYKNSDETTHQYPLTFYSTFYCQTSLFTGKTDDRSITFTSDDDYQNYYYLLNCIGAETNRIYHHQVPPAIYLVTIVKQILYDAGWKLGGQFFNDDKIKKIILLYAGEDDAYDQAISPEAEGEYAGSNPINLNLAKFLPDMNQANFLKNIINMFNLYFVIDDSNKIVYFETYNTFFNNGDVVDPYDLTDMIDQTTMNLTYIENNDPSITFSKANNRKLFGDNKVMSGATTNAFEQIWTSISDKNYRSTFNRIGTTDEIELDFSEPTIKRQFIWNDRNVNSTQMSGRTHVGYLPLLSKQSDTKNNNMKFNKKDTDTYVFNNESSIKFDGDGCFMYYYGPCISTYVNKTGKGPISDYMFYNMFNHTGNTWNRVVIPVVSPFQLTDFRTEINGWLNGYTNTQIDDKRTVTASYLQSLWQMMGGTNLTDDLLTDFSLVFDDNGFYHRTLWSKFHKPKWDRYRDSEVLEANIRMNSHDWKNMQINRPLKLGQEYYHLISITGFNPLTQTAQIKMIKTL